MRERTERVRKKGVEKNRRQNLNASMPKWNSSNRDFSKHINFR